MKSNNNTKKNKTITNGSPNSLILIKTNQTEKVKKILEQEKVDHEIYSSGTNLKAKTFSKSKNTKELMKRIGKLVKSCPSCNSLRPLRTKWWNISQEKPRNSRLLKMGKGKDMMNQNEINCFIKQL